MQNELITRIASRRKELKISQRDLAARCNVPQSTIARIEAGTVAPNLNTLNKIFEELDIDISVSLNARHVTDRWEGREMLCFWKDEVVSYISIRDNKVKIQRFTLHPVKQIFNSDELDLYKFSCVLETRCWQRECKNIDNYLTKLNVPYYDPLAIIEKTHGVSYNDFLWFKQNGENLQWKDVAPRRFRNV